MVEEKKEPVKVAPINNTLEEVAPVLPQEENEEQFEKDLQKELEAKFDELFGPIDEE